MYRYYPTDIKIYNYGRMDSWNTAREPGYGMSYFTRADLPYYYALYDHFLCGDQYFQSTFTCTNPNRMHLFTGSNGLSVGEKAVLENEEPRPGYNWTTMAEVLEACKLCLFIQKINYFLKSYFYVRILSQYILESLPAA